MVPLIFFSIASSIASIADTKRVGKLLALTIGIFVVTAAIAGIYMFIVTGIFGVDTSIQLDTSEVAAAAAADSVGDQIVNTFTVSDFPLVISRSHILALIVFTVFFGVTVSLLGEQGKPVVSWLNSMSLVFYKMVALLMKLAPIGLMAYFANLTGTYGPELLKSYARGLLILLSCRHRVFLCVSGAVRVSGSRYLGRKELLQEYPDAGHHCIGAPLLRCGPAAPTGRLR